MAETSFSHPVSIPVEVDQQWQQPDADSTDSRTDQAVTRLSGAGGAVCLYTRERSQTMFEQSVLSFGAPGKRALTTCLGMSGQAILVACLVAAPMVFPQVLPMAKIAIQLVP